MCMCMYLFKHTYSKEATQSHNYRFFLLVASGSCGRPPAGPLLKLSEYPRVVLMDHLWLKAGNFEENILWYHGLFTSTWKKSCKTWFMVPITYWC